MTLRLFLPLALMLFSAWYLAPLLAPPNLTANSRECEKYFREREREGDDAAIVPPPCFFSANYDEAREKFLTLAKRLRNCRVTSLPIDKQRGLYIDVAEITSTSSRAIPSKLLISIAGTHGVEGFAGSGIQTSILSDMLSNERAGGKHALEEDLGVMFVHAFNPFGFKYLRRGNENGVDLNRNGIFITDPALVAAREHNVAGYEDIADDLSPREPFSLASVFRLLSRLPRIYCKMGGSFRALKRALVTGTYNPLRNNTLNYGGSKPEKSYLLLEEYLRKRGYLSPGATTDVVILDIHTGIGEKGVDTLMVEERFQEDAAKAFPDSAREVQNRAESVGDADVASGYDLTVGGVPETLGELFTRASASSRPLVLTQEFGTLPPLLVALASMAENQDWFHGSAGRAFKEESAAQMESFRSKRWLRAAFFVDDEDFTREIVRRGRKVFWNAVTFLASRSSGTS